MKKFKECIMWRVNQNQEEVNTFKYNKISTSKLLKVRQNYLLS